MDRKRIACELVKIAKKLTGAFIPGDLSVSKKGRVLTLRKPLRGGNSSVSGFMARVQDEAKKLRWVAQNIIDALPMTKPYDNEPSVDLSKGELSVELTLTTRHDDEQVKKVLKDSMDITVK